MPNQSTLDSNPELGFERAQPIEASKAKAADETDKLRALECNKQIWVRGDDEAEQDFIDRASADARRQQAGSKIVIMLQTAVKAICHINIGHFDN